MVADVCFGLGMRRMGLRVVWVMFGLGGWVLCGLGLWAKDLVLSTKGWVLGSGR